MDTPTTRRIIQLNTYERYDGVTQVSAIAYLGEVGPMREATASRLCYITLGPEDLATLRAELVETVTRLAGWADHDVEVIG